MYGMCVLRITVISTCNSLQTAKKRFGFAHYFQLLGKVFFFLEINRGLSLQTSDVYLRPVRSFILDGFFLQTRLMGIFTLCTGTTFLS